MIQDEYTTFISKSSYNVSYENHRTPLSMEEILELTCLVRISDIVSDKHRFGFRVTSEDVADLLDAILDIDRFATKDVDDR